MLSGSVVFPQLSKLDAEQKHAALKLRGAVVAGLAAPYKAGTLKKMYELGWPRLTTVTLA